MKNAFGTKENLELFNKNGIRVYNYWNSGRLITETIYNSNGNHLKSKRSDGFTSKSTFDLFGHELTYKDSVGIWFKCTYDSNGNQLTYKDSSGCHWKRKYDSNGNEIEFKQLSITKKRTLIECTLEEFYQEFKEQ
tara:strand:- start:177 stop:581 length:405 start_codon:yes stop_codon:yes gene_type:complete